VVVMTAWGTVDVAVEAMRRGARDFVQKPWDNEKLLGSLRRYVEEGRVLREKRREIREARDVQQRLLPAGLNGLPGYDIQAYWKPVHEVGGDYFDAIRIGGASVGICIADVAGKGLPAALLMSNMQASVRAFAQRTTSPAEMCRELNRVALENAKAARFTTLFYAVLDSDSRSLRYTNAGHVPPIVLRRDGTIHRLSDGGTVLGIFRDADYEETQVRFDPGDRLVLITDGITEARNGQDEEFGEERLLRLVQEHRELSAGSLQRVLLDELEFFAAGPLQDDATLMIVSKTLETRGEHKRLASGL